MSLKTMPCLRDLVTVEMLSVLVMRWVHGKIIIIIIKNVKIRVTLS